MNKTNLLDFFIFGMVSILITGSRCEAIYSEVFAAEGSDVVLPCKYPAILISSPPAIVWSHKEKGTIWRKERSGLEYRGSRWSQRVQCPHLQLDSGTFSIQINNVTEDDVGLYSCKVDLKNQVIEKQVMLRLIKVSFSPPAPVSGSNTQLSCALKPWRHGVSVEWMLNNNPYFPQAKTGLHGDKVSKVLRVTEKESGTWTCVVTYKGEKGQASAALDVKGIIQPPKDNAKVYATVGSPVTLPCVFSSGLRTLSAGWEKINPVSPSTRDLQLLSLASSSPDRLRWDRSIRINEVTYEDEGKYRCSGNVGQQRLTRTLQLVVAKIVRLKQKYSTTLTCQLSDASEVTEYEWAHVTYDENGTAIVGSIQKGKDIIITDGSEESWGEWTCSFYGQDGLLGNVTYNTHLMSGLSGQKSSSASNNTATVVGLSFLLIVLLLIVAQMYKNRQRRKRIFQYPALETIVHTISNEREERERNREKI
ncbi:lymphocyte activation gene 3 protein-like [Simochromis diagramma]|uniref:lymphocyte activation gene 3 protein-like n=1 Tax=Simochromis diagramma TaxID=43689 RepID=UPI001A7E58DB|nr:lymphocyte activation gene 3 protein-like [Simochromis diagramma]